MRGTILQEIKASQEAVVSLEANVETIERITEVFATCLLRGGKIFFFGNGGSAADAQHLAAELQGRFLLERQPLAAVALTTNSSSVTAIANDYSYEEVFSRQLRGLGHHGDVAVGISTSGESKNVLRAIEAAREMGLTTVGFCGQHGTLNELVEFCLAVRSTSAPHIQEAHIAAGHIICQVVEARLARG